MVSSAIVVKLHTFVVKLRLMWCMVTTTMKFDTPPDILLVDPSSCTDNSTTAIIIVAGVLDHSKLLDSEVFIACSGGFNRWEDLACSTQHILRQRFEDPSFNFGLACCGLTFPA